MKVNMVGESLCTINDNILCTYKYNTRLLKMNALILNECYSLLKNGTQKLNIIHES